MAILGSWQVSLAQVTYSGAQTGVALNQSTSVSPASYSPAAKLNGSSLAVGSNVASSSSFLNRDWAIEVANAKMNLNPNQFPDIGLARQQLDQSMSELEGFLSTSPQHQANWLTFLQWNELRAELAKKEPDRERLEQIEKTFRQNYLGLELRQFTNVRDSLSKYVQSLLYSADRSSTLEFFGNRLSKLSEQLKMPNASQNFESTREIGQTIAYLLQGNQARDLANAVRAGYSKSNVRILVSSDFISKQFSRPVSEPHPVNELILGTQIIGNSWLEGSVMPQLMDSARHAAIRLNFQGDFHSRSIGYNRSVKLHTQGSGSVSASETISLMENGLVPMNDTVTDANLSSQIDSIDAKLRIVRKIASKEAARQKPQGDAIAMGRLENRIRSQFHEKLSDQLTDANQRLKSPDLPILTRLGLERPTRSSWSSSQYLALLWKLQGSTQLAAPSSCPLVVDPTGITVQVHESIITNLLDPVLAGRILKSTELDLLAVQLGDALGKGTTKKKEDEPWAVTMAIYHPVEVQLDNSLVTFRVRTKKLDRGDQVLEQPASIEASYKITLIDGAIDLERIGDVKIAFSGKQQQGAKGTILRSFLKRKLEEAFKVKLLDEPVRVTDRLPNDLKSLQLQSIHVDDGWFQFHLK